MPKKSYHYPNILILGHARHGKDTVAEMLCGPEFNLGGEFKPTLGSSSLIHAEKVMMPYFGDKYASAQECYDDRVNHRAEWYDQIALFNKDDPTRSATLVLKESNFYVGMRNKREILSCKLAGLFDMVVWVDASDRLPLEDRSSMTAEPWMADFHLDNNGDLDNLVTQVSLLYQEQILEICAIKQFGDRLQ